MAEHVCPVWVAYLLASPIRKLFQNPDKVLAPYIIPGHKVLEIGPGMGFFTLPMAKMVGQNGRVYAVDLQEEMLNKIKVRAKKANVPDSITTLQCTFDSLGLENINDEIDFVLMMAVLHEIPDQKHALEQVFNKVKTGGLVLLSEPGGHVKAKDFEETLSVAEKIGFKLETCPDITKNLSVLMSKPA